MTYRGGATFLGYKWYVPCVVSRAHLAGLAKSDALANGPHIVQVQQTSALPASQVAHVIVDKSRSHCVVNSACCIIKHYRLF